MAIIAGIVDRVPDGNDLTIGGHRTCNGEKGAPAHHQQHAQISIVFSGHMRDFPFYQASVGTVTNSFNLRILTANALTRFAADLVN
jgi:hypothetical protein